MRDPCPFIDIAEGLHVICLLLFFTLFSCFLSRSVCGQDNADYAFLMDASGSILPSEFQILKDFIKRVIDFLQIGPALTHVGVIEYSRGANMELSFSTSYDKEEIKKLVDAVPHTAGITRIDLALKVASEQLFTPQGGMRENARKVNVGQSLHVLYPFTALSIYVPADGDFATVFSQLLATLCPLDFTESLAQARGPGIYCLLPLLYCLLTLTYT